MNETESYYKTEEIISKFKNGKTRYMESPLFNQVIQTLVRDVDVYIIIEHLICVTEDCQNALIQQMHRSQHPSINLYDKK